MSTIGEIRISRRIGNVSGHARISFHAFSDASGLTYAAAVFIRVEADGKTNVQLIRAKSRIAPTREITIPRLELLAAITARLAVSLISAFKFTDPEIIYWSDSTTVLSWIKREAQWNTFVWNRIQEIRQLTSSATWRYLLSSDNPADLPSRMQLPAACRVAMVGGPAMARLPRDQWPASDFDVKEQEVNCELKKSVIKANTLLN